MDIPIRRVWTDSLAPLQPNQGAFALQGASCTTEISFVSARSCNSNVARYNLSERVGELVDSHGKKFQLSIPIPFDGRDITWKLMVLDYLLGLADSYV